MSGVMRIKVRSLRPWRIASCAAACGMRWVKPSKAAVSPSRRFSATASRRLWNLVITGFRDRGSNIEEHRFLLALQANVEGIDGTIAALGARRDQGWHPHLVLDTRQHRALGVGRFLVGEVHARVQADVDAARDDPEGDVRGLRAAVL